MADTTDEQNATAQDANLGPGPASSNLGDARIAAAIAAARYHGADLDGSAFRAAPGEKVPSALTMVSWLRESGLWAKATRLTWKNLVRVSDGAPVMLFFTDGGAGMLVGADPKRNVIWLKDPLAPPGEQPVAVDELRLSQVWKGEAILVRKARGQEIEEPRFNLRWLFKLVLREKTAMRDIAIGSVTLSALTIIPPLLVMTVINRVVVHHSMNTLALISLIILIGVIYEMFLTHARRELLQVLSARLDTRINLTMFDRLLALPIDFFERTTTGETMYRLNQIWRIREFITGRLLTTFLDLFTVFMLLPILFWLDATLSWMVLGGSVVIALIIAAFLPGLGLLQAKVSAAESQKGTIIAETVYGIRTVKTLALEPARKSLWDEAVADAGRKRLEMGRLSSWPQTLILPFERFIERGVLLVGAFIALNDSSGVQIGALIAFMLLGGRLAHPLVSMARLLEEFEQVRASVDEVGHVLNNPTETKALTQGVRPKLLSEISFEDVTFTYPTGKMPALDRVGFTVPAGTMLGVVGRSGSGKSTLTRLLQGINREYSGFVKIDGAELREINLTHLRRSLGVVLQDNFLFRGTVRDNIIANRPGLTLEDAIRSARLAGAEEFIERLPAGYDTQIEEGSSNLSGGQKQRLAIARALISDPKLLILDEATSALDPESEALVNANLQRIAKGRTMIIVSHRLSSLVDCDQILVLDKGKVEDCAPHHVLVERCAVYRQLWMQQHRHMQGPGRPGLAPVLAQGD